MRLTREGLDKAKNILALSSHSAGTIAEDFPDFAGKTSALPGGVDTDLRPDALDLGILNKLSGGPGRGPEQRAALKEAIGALRVPTSCWERSAGSQPPTTPARTTKMPANDSSALSQPMLRSWSTWASSSTPRASTASSRPLRGAHRDGRASTRDRLRHLREGLEALALALSTGDEKTVERLAELGKLLEGGQAGPLEHFEVSQELLQDAAGMEDDVEFIGPLRHEELTRLLPAAELGVVPSIFPETFGLVAAELAACG